MPFLFLFFFFYIILPAPSGCLIFVLCGRTLNPMSRLTIFKQTKKEHTRTHTHTQALLTGNHTDEIVFPMLVFADTSNPMTCQTANNTGFNSATVTLIAFRGERKLSGHYFADMNGVKHPKVPFFINTYFFVWLLSGWLVIELDPLKPQQIQGCERCAGIQIKTS